MKADVQEQRIGFWLWLPMVLVLPIFAVALFASAAVEFTR
jgi:hypothetical protein